MRQVKILVVLVDEVKEKLIDHFTEVLSQPGELRRRLMDGDPLPNLGTMRMENLSALARECDLYRHRQRADGIEQVWMLIGQECAMYRVSAPERDEATSPVCRICGKPLDGGYCSDQTCFYFTNQQSVDYHD